MDTQHFFIVCVRCSGSGMEHESSRACTQCQGARVLQTTPHSHVVALEFLRVAQPVLGLVDYEESAALRSAVEGIARWLAAHPGDVSLEPPEPLTVLNPRSTRP